MNFAQEIELYFRSRFTCIGIVSFEEERILHQLKEVCEKSRRALYTWDHADFFQPPNDAGGTTPVAKDSVSVLEAIDKMEEMKGGAVFTSAGRDRYGSFASCATWRRS